MEDAWKHRGDDVEPFRVGKKRRGKHQRVVLELRAVISDEANLRQGIIKSDLFRDFDQLDVIVEAPMGALGTLLTTRPPLTFGTQCANFIGATSPSDICVSLSIVFAAHHCAIGSPPRGDGN